jgi:hypothetical protein
VTGTQGDETTNFRAKKSQKSQRPTLSLFMSSFQPTSHGPVKVSAIIKMPHHDGTSGGGVPDIDPDELGMCVYAASCSRYILNPHAEIGDIIGQGSFATVYRGKCRGVAVAVKVLDTKGLEIM